MKFIVNGAHKLEGDIEVGGSKNAATPVLAATLLTKRPCVIKNLPLIDDVLSFVELLESVGSRVEWIEDRTVRIINESIDPRDIDRTKVRRMRSSALLIGPLLARVGEVAISTPGGCYIGVRPMDAHLEAFRDAGFDYKYDEKSEDYYISKSDRNGSREVTLKEFSVTATENILMYAVAKGDMKIRIAAAEPHIQGLGKFLMKLGASVGGLGTHEITVQKPLEEDGGEVEFTIMNDPIEAGTFLALGAASKSDIRIVGAPVESLTFPFQKLKEFGVVYEVRGSDVSVFGSTSKLRAVPKLMTQPYPGFPTDLQAPFGVLATQCEGKTLIFETMYEGRLKYLSELEKMGAEVEILDPHRAVVTGPTPLAGTNVESIDLRAGATLVIAALIAEGKSVLHTAEQIDRGYERIEERLQKLGADIQRVEE